MFNSPIHTLQLALHNRPQKLAANCNPVHLLCDVCSSRSLSEQLLFKTKAGRHCTSLKALNNQLNPH